jgi:hypothetical protein
MAFLFRSELEEKEQTLAEVRTKFSKNKQILTSNWEQAEAEVSPVAYIWCSGSGIRCLFDPWFRDPGWVKSLGTSRIIFPRA